MAPYDQKLEIRRTETRMARAGFPASHHLGARPPTIKKNARRESPQEAFLASGVLASNQPSSFLSPPTMPDTSASPSSSSSKKAFSSSPAGISAASSPRSTISSSSAAGTSLDPSSASSRLIILGPSSTGASASGSSTFLVSRG